MTDEEETHDDYVDEAVPLDGDEGVAGPAEAEPDEEAEEEE
jgi:hypothetical protein